MKKFLTFSFSISFLLIALVIAYYFVIYVPKRDQMRQDQQIMDNAEKSRVLMDCSQKVASVAKDSPGAFMHYQELMKICLQGKGYSN